MLNMLWRVLNHYLFGNGKNNMKIELIDCYDKDVTPAVKALLFSDIITEIKGNDLCYYVYSDSITDLNPDDEYAKEAWEKRQELSNHGDFNGSLEQAIQEFKNLLIKRKVKEDEDFIVNIWW